MAVFNSTEVLSNAFLNRLSEGYRSAFGNVGGREHEYGNVIRAAANMAIETIAQSDAPYHDVEHTMLVTLVGQEIIRGKLLSEGGVTPYLWAHFTIALLCHDIGYVRGICPGDRDDAQVIDAKGTMIPMPRTCTDAFLTPHHVERGKIFVESRFGAHPGIDTAFIIESIENTRFPVPDDSDPKENANWAGLVRAADLIGQLADPDYLRKLPALYREFVETGANERMGYRDPADLRDGYPDFFWGMVHKHLDAAIFYLRATQQGRQWLAGLFSHVFYQEHRSDL